MARYFLDSSALVKRYILEEGTDWVTALLEGDEDLAVSRLALVEVTATVVRRLRAGDLTKDDAEAVLVTLEGEFRSRFSVIELSGALLTRSVDLVRSHALRASDAIQLACSVIVASSGSDQSRLVFVSSDLELNSAAEKEGMSVLNPQSAA